MPEHRKGTEIALDDLLISLGVSEQEKVLSLLAQRIAEFAPEPKKVLAMYYYENIKLSEIAALFDLAESRIRELHAQTVAALRSYLVTVLTQNCSQELQTTRSSQLDAKRFATPPAPLRCDSPG
jgi:DNA-directed RNA polymerase specialized sigma subunit